VWGTNDTVHIPGTTYTDAELNILAADRDTLPAKSKWENPKWDSGGRAVTVTPETASYFETVSTALLPSESGGFYADTGGYGWNYNSSNGSIDMVFAPGGGTRITFYKSDPKWAGIYNLVVKGKQPGTKASVAASAAKSGGKETSGKSVGSTTSAGAPRAASVPVASTGGVSPTAPGTPLWEQGWFLPVVGGTVLVGVLAIAFWPSKP
jgi:hypothetical protein